MGVVKERVARVDWRDARACLEIAGMWNRITYKESCARVNAALESSKGQVSEKCPMGQ